MKKAITYENDKDLGLLIYTEITDEKLLEFFFKKCGKVNVNNLNWCYSTYGPKHTDLAKHIVSLEVQGLIKPIDSIHYKLTFKARIEWIYKHKSLAFWSTIATIAGTIIAILVAIKLIK
jgi:hypothetical protein